MIDLCRPDGLIHINAAEALLLEHHHPHMATHNGESKSLRDNVVRLRSSIGVKRVFSCGCISYHVGETSGFIFKATECLLRKPYTEALCA